MNCPFHTLRNALDEPNSTREALEHHVFEGFTEFESSDEQVRAARLAHSAGIMYGVTCTADEILEIWYALSGKTWQLSRCWYEMPTVDVIEATINQNR